jgi:hypothetical protein
VENFAEDILLEGLFGGTNVIYIVSSREWETFMITMREPPLRKTWEYSNITHISLISYERGWPLACLDDLIKPNQASHQGAR